VRRLGAGSSFCTGVGVAAVNYADDGVFDSLVTAGPSGDKKAYLYDPKTGPRRSWWERSSPPWRSSAHL
jgi:hypothetical protein